MRSLLIVLFGWVIATASARGEIRIRVQDYAKVPPATLAKAIAVASAVLQGAGMKVMWANCSPDSKVLEEVCHMPLGALDLQIRILNQPMAKRSLGSRHSMGYALLAGQFPSIAAVFYHRAVELEGGNLAKRAEILGSLLAHEIGHLLLRENSHSDAGILRARWGDQELKLIARGRMSFTAEQADRMISLAAERRRADVTQFVMQPQQKFVDTDEDEMVITMPVTGTQANQISSIMDIRGFRSESSR